ncbi:MAG: PilZ domain-containing protein [Pyrinomonadaceae bacterium]
MKGKIEDRRLGERFVIAFPIRVRWKDENGKEVTQDGLTDNIGPVGTLVYLPRHLPNVGSKVHLTVTENPKDEVSVTAQVIRLERNAAHPQAALQLTDSMRLWKKKVWETARATIAAQEPEELDDW